MPTIKDVERYLEIQNQKRDLEKQARALGKNLDVLAGELTELVNDEGGRKRLVTKGKYTLRMVETSGTVSWKSEYIDYAGEAAAAKLIAEAPTREKLSVSRT